MSTRDVSSPYLTTDEAVSYLKLRTKQALYYHVRENNLPHGRIGSTLRFDRAELDAWITNQMHVVPAKRTKRIA